MNSTRISFFFTLLLLAGNISLRAATKPQATQTTDQGTTSTSKPTKNNSTRDSAATTPAAPAKPGQAPAPAAPATPRKPAAAPAQTPPANGSGMVWVNTESGVYHRPGSRYYGKTKQGKYMTETDARKAGYRAAAKN